MSVSPPSQTENAPLRSVHTTNFPQILTQLGISLVVSTYQAGKLIVLRADGETINTHFRVFKKPMGLAADRGRLAIGTAYQIWELRNVPAICPVTPRLPETSISMKWLGLSGNCGLSILAFPVCVP